MIDTADMEMILERVKEVCVTRQECNTTMEDVNRKLSNDATELALIKQTLNTISWVSKTTLGAVLVTIVGAILKLIGVIG